MTGLQIAFVLGFVLFTFGVTWKWFIGSLLAEVEAERTDLARDAHYTGKVLR